MWLTFDRLLSDAGIPKLRRITKDRLKFRGKGHEFADMSRMLTLYQLWLDDLYPKAKFRDALTMVEKLGHSKRMQVSRRAWIDETKSSQERDDEEYEEHEERQRSSKDAQAGDGDVSSKPEASSGRKNQELQDSRDQVPEDDDLDALLAEEASAAQMGPQNTMPRRKGPFDDNDDEDEPGEDKLDAPHSGDQARPTQTKVFVPLRKGPFQEDQDSDQDELDALLAEEPKRQEPISSRNLTKPTEQHVIRADNDFADEEEAMRDMDW